MARPLRIDVPGGIVHVTARGNNRAAIFPSGEHRDRLVATVGAVVSRYGWLCHAHVVMHNHYHLLVETPLPNLSLGLLEAYRRYGYRLREIGAHLGVQSPAACSRPTAATATDSERSEPTSASTRQPSAVRSPGSNAARRTARTWSRFAGMQDLTPRSILAFTGST